jgi:hypothetical protein
VFRIGFESCALKINRAREHVKNLEREITTWRDGEPYRLIKECDSEGYRHSQRITVIREPDIERLSLIAGDAFHNLRAALDHCIYAIAKIQTKTDPPPGWKRLALPISDSPDGFRRRLSQGWLTGISDAVRNEIVCLQPYRRPHTHLAPLLGLLRDFDDADKHRLLHIVLGRAYSHSLYDFKDAEEDPILVYDLNFFQGPIENGSEIVSFRTRKAAPNLNYKFQAAVTISVEHPPGPAKFNFSPVTDFLELLDKEVCFVIDTLSGLI